MKRLLFRGTLWLILAAAPALAVGPFVSPTETSPFRRDRLPLDVDTMTSLSRRILLIAKTLETEGAATRRASAQCLALALALDPTNREARETLTLLSDGKSASQPDAAEIEPAKAKIWQILAWLESSEAGSEGQALGACIMDAMTVADPAHPKSQARKGQGEAGKWTGWVADLASFEERVVVNVPDANQPKEPLIPAEGPEPRFLRTTAVVSTPLWTFDKESDKVLIRPLQVSMSASIEGEQLDRRGFHVKLESTEDGDSISQTARVILTALKGINDSFPEGGVVSLNVGKGVDYLALKNRQGISAAAAVLVDSAVSGREPNATVLGVVQEDGSLKLPPRAWDKIRVLSDGPGGRLVLPREAEALLPSILAIEDPAFFMKYEVVLADNLKELVEFSAKGGSGELADASVRFGEIREKMGSNQVSQYVANRFVRQRLGEIAQACPDHLSARMLSIQGGGERPTRLPKQILASEIRRALEPMTALPSDLPDNLDAGLCDATYEKCRALLDPLERYVDIRDRDFFGHAKELLTTVRTVGRVKRTARDNHDTGVTNRVATQQAYEAMKSAYSKVRAELAEAANDDEPKDVPRDFQKGGMRDRFPPDRFKGLK